MVFAHANGVDGYCAERGRPKLGKQLGDTAKDSAPNQLGGEITKHTLAKFSHELLVGVKYIWTHGWRCNYRWTVGVLIVGDQM